MAGAVEGGPALALSGIAGGWLLAFTFSFDEFVIAWFVSGFDPTLPVTIYTYLAASADPSLNAIASIIFVFSGLLLHRRGTARDPDADTRLRPGSALSASRLSRRHAAEADQFES